MRSYDSLHPKGSKYSTGELIRHRDNWYSKINAGVTTLNSEHTKQLDANVFSRIKALLPWDGPIRFAGSFPDSRVNGFYEFMAECDDPSFEFIDPDLESLRAALRAEIMVFSSNIGFNTWATYYNVNAQTVPPEWKREDPERFEKVVTLLNESGTRVGEAYDTLVRGVRMKMGIE